MDKIVIHGGQPLSGSIKISGSKNSALPILAATLLTREPCILHRVPDLSDTHYMLQILTHLGASVERASGTVSVNAEKIESIAPYDVVRKMRASPATRTWRANFGKWRESIKAKLPNLIMARCLNSAIHRQAWKVS